MRNQLNTVEQVIARLASVAHGIVTHRELVAAGISPSEIHRRVRKGLLIPVYRGVYRVGHRAPSLEADYMAAVKAGGETALICRMAAAHLLELVWGPAPQPEIAAPRAVRVRGLVAHHVRGLGVPDGFRYRGLPVTTVPRTLVDLAAILDENQLALAVHRAHVRFKTRPPHVEAALQRRPNTPGAGTLRRVLRGDVNVALSRLESRFQQLLERAGLPRPETNLRVGTKFVDCRWKDPPLTVELDSFQYHNTRHSWEQDHQRAREARNRRDAFRRYTWHDVFAEPESMLAELRELLQVGRRRAA